MKIVKEFSVELKGELSNRYAMLSKTLAHITVLIRILTILTNRTKEYRHETISESDFFINYNMWISLYTQYHFLFSKSLDVTSEMKASKHKIEESDLENASEDLKTYHKNIMKVRNHYIVHGGSNLYSEHSVVAKITVYAACFKTQLVLDETKSPDISNENILLMSRLLNYLKDLILAKIKKVEDKIADKILSDFENVKPNTVYIVDK